MKQLKKVKGRLSIVHKRFPHDLILKSKGEVMSCKYCKRTPLVGGFDMTRTIENKDEAMCFECYQAGRAEESSIISLGRALSGYYPDENKVFPLAPKKGTSHREMVGRNCATCKKPIYWNPYKKKLIGAYNELLRGITVHEKCGIPK